MENRLASIRKEMNLTQKMVSKLTNITAPSLSAYERGKQEIPSNKWEILSTIYDAPIDYLLCLTDKRYSIKLFNELLHIIHVKNLNPIKKVKDDLSFVGITTANFDNLKDQLINYCIFCFEHQLTFNGIEEAYNTFILYLRAEILRASVADKINLVMSQKEDIENKLHGDKKENALKELDVYMDLLLKKYKQTEEQFRNLKNQT